MKITKSKLAAASFGAAMSSLYSAPELSASIAINFDVNTVAFYTGFAGSNALTPIEFTNATAGSYGIPGGNAAVGVFNDSYGVAVFREFFTGFNGGIQTGGFGVVNAGDVFTNGTANEIYFGASETGVRYIGFVAGGALGWFSIDLGTTPTDTVTLLEGQFDQGATIPLGQGIVVGATGVPEPSSVGLGLLGMGLAGLRRRRKAAAAAA